MQEKLRTYFLEYVDKKSFFVNKNILTHSYIPNEILHRDEQISNIAKILAPALKLEQPSNIFIYGTTGTGKSVVVNYIFKELSAINNKNLKTIYINCKLRKTSDTEYRMLAYILKELNFPVPETGLPTETLYNKLFDLINERKQILLLALDELDALIKKIGDELLYNLTRINAELTKSKITLIGISNDISFTENLDPRVKSSLSEEEIIFPPYNAIQLKDILEERAKKALKPNVFSEGVISKCAALAAQEQGDARRALDLLRVAAEIAERNEDPKITEQHVTLAEQKLELDRVVELAKLQPRHSQLVLYSIFKLFEKGADQILTGDIYDIYISLCKRNGYRFLTQRRVSDLISELDMLGLISAKVVSKGRYGRTREIKLAIAKKPFDLLKSYFSNLFEI
ncbi:MAG: orc1/cdc6 family replication initiation protein [Candidatus Aenigmarchaeota archaeon]|nr:orc1/cdc6 family replication initiation protein [Candidatus Aenigmarchaeota archaeon]